MKRIFDRSEERHKLQYTEYYGDGDSKGFNGVENTYMDNGLKVVKKECLGHVQKRVGTALRKLKKEKKGTGGKGKLTDRMIDRLQNYYGRAIRSDVGNLSKMKNAIYASLMQPHVFSFSQNTLSQHSRTYASLWRLLTGQKSSNAMRICIW